MRKLNSFVLILFAFSLFFVVSSFAQQPSSMETVSIDSKTEVVKIKYDLAFPGILPDNPLYKLKVLRDKINIMLITDPYKRIEFYLLQADKGILATAILIDKNKISLAEQTALKAEHNMTLITYELKRLSDKPDNELFEKLKTASKKHQEVLSTIIERVPSENHKTFNTVTNFSKVNLQTIEKLQSKKYYSK